VVKWPNPGNEQRPLMKTMQKIFYDGLKGLKGEQLKVLSS
jgi:hypothetical protein